MLSVRVGGRATVATIVACAFSASGAVTSAQSLEPIEQLGKSIFFDTFLSVNGDQSCASCHGPDAGWTGPLSDVNAHGGVYEGSVGGHFGNRKPPSAAYAASSPIFHMVIETGRARFVGGNFWDGRATGERLGNPAADQAQGPFLNPLEQALPDSACVVHAVCTAPPSLYPVAFETVWGPDACAVAWPADIDEACAGGDSLTLSDEDRAAVSRGFDEVALSIAAYEASGEVSAYTSKFDYFLKGLVDLSRRERQGLNLFRGKGRCARCHVLERGPEGEGALLTDFGFANLGVPRNPENPFYDMDAFNPAGEGWVDTGLGGVLASNVALQHLAPENYGRHKTPTLRNVDKRPEAGFVKAYMHNGYFKSLKSVVHFYNTRDVKPTCDDPFTTEEEALALNCWPAPEVPYNVETRNVGRLRLTDAQEDAIVAFLKTLSDGYALGDAAGPARGGD